jgi:trehalose-6-phosphate synthase
VVSEDETADSIAMALLAATKLRASSRAAMSTELKRQIAEFDASYWAASVISDLKILEPV